MVHEKRCYIMLFFLFSLKDFELFFCKHYQLSRDKDFSLVADVFVHIQAKARYTEGSVSTQRGKELKTGRIRMTVESRRNMRFWKQLKASEALPVS